MSQTFSIPDLDLPQESAEVSALSQQLSERESLLAALSLKYTPQYPDVVRLTKEVELLKQKLETEKARTAQSTELTPLGQEDKNQQTEMQSQSNRALPTAENFELASVNSDIRRRENDRERILGDMKRIQARLNLSPALEQELRVLSREHQTIANQFDSLQGKKFQAQMTTNLETDENNDIYRIVDEANLPEKPISPKRLQLILMGLCAGFALGIGIAFGLELFDTTLGREEEVATLLKLPTLAIISEIPKRDPKQLRGLAKSA